MREKKEWTKRKGESEERQEERETDRQTDCKSLIEINWNNLPGVRTRVRSYKSLKTIIGTTDTPSHFIESCDSSTSLATCLHPPSI